MIVDDSILEGCIAGKRSAQTLLYKKFASTMLGVCMRYSSNRDEAEDIVQEGFIKVFQRISSFRREGSFEGWMKRIMINQALNHYRKNKKVPYHSLIEEIDETEILDLEDAEPFEPVPTEKLMKLIQNLPEGYRMVFNLYVFEEFSHKDIAESLNVSESTSKTQLLKARRLLRKKILELTQTKKSPLPHE
jgi:RNA polymerase sigma factor (sigma-70 family)